MAEEEEAKTTKKRVVVESLGWLTESSIMPKKHREISGVGASSIMELKAQLYKSQEDSKKSRDLAGPDVQFHRAKSKIVSRNPLTAKNSGVDARALKDKLELKAVNDGSVSYAALERKAEIFEKLMSGELSDEEEKEKYCVDFFRKRLEDNGSHSAEQHRDSSSDPGLPPENEDGENDDDLLFNMKPAGLGRAAASRDDDEHKRFVREVHEEASQAREKATELKLRRQEQATARREKLKQAYLRKQLERVKAASSSEKS